MDRAWIQGEVRRPLAHVDNCHRLVSPSIIHTPPDCLHPCFGSKYCLRVWKCSPHVNVGSFEIPHINVRFHYIRDTN